MSFDQALRMFTVEAAYSLFEENDKVTLEVGKLADMVVITGDPTAIPASEWESRLEVEMTVFGGKVVYER